MRKLHAVEASHLHESTEIHRDEIHKKP